MAITPAARNVMLTNVSAAIYTPTTGYNAWLDGVTLTNTDASAILVTLKRGADADANKVTVTIPAGKSYAVKELVGHWLLNATSLYGLAGTTGVVACLISAREFAV